MATDEIDEKKAYDIALEDYRTYGEHLRAALKHYYDSLNERNKVRKAMLVAAAISLSVSYTTILPNQIAVLGITSQDIPHIYIYLILSVFCAYFGLHFSIVAKASKVNITHLVATAGKRNRIRAVLTKDVLSAWVVQELQDEFELDYMLPITYRYSGEKRSIKDAQHRQSIITDGFQVYLPLSLGILAVLWPIYRAWLLVE